MRDLYGEIVLGVIVVTAMWIGDSFFAGILYSIVVVIIIVVVVVVVGAVGGTTHGASTPRQIPPSKDPHHCLTHPAALASFVLEGHRSSFAVANGARREQSTIAMMSSRQAGCAAK